MSDSTTNTTSTTSNQGQATAITWATISKMTPKDYAERQPEIAAWIAQHPSPRTSK